MKVRLLLSVPVLFFAATALPATDYFVSPTLGDNANSGGDAGNAWKTITYALDNLLNPSPAVSGDTVYLLTGTYDATSGETFPLVLPEGVSLLANNGAGVALDGGGTGTVLQVVADTSSTTMRVGLESGNTTGVLAIQNFSTTGIQLDGTAAGFASVQVNGVELDADFGAIGAYAVLGTFSTGTSVVSLTNLNIGGAVRPETGIALISMGAILEGEVADCVAEYTDTGLALHASALAAPATIGSTQDSNAYQSTFTVLRNTFSGVGGEGQVGIDLLAEATGSVAICAPRVQGNVCHSNATVGINFKAVASSGATASTPAWIAYNSTQGNAVNMHGEAVGAAAAGAIIASARPHLIGNNIANATTYGVHLEAFQGVPGGESAEAYLGGGPSVGGDVAHMTAFGMNSIRNNNGNYSDLAVNQAAGNFYCQKTFWVDQTPMFHIADENSGFGQGMAFYTPTFVDSYPDAALLPSSVESGQRTDIVITSGGTSAFVDNPDTESVVGQLGVLIDGLAAESYPGVESVLVWPDGSSVVITGTWTNDDLGDDNLEVMVIDPWGNGAETFNLTVESSVGGTKSVGCFVATAAHGGYEAPQVRALRRFRDQTLLDMPGGERFVRGYYAISPSVADWIAERPAARAAVRVALMPVVGFARLAALDPWRVGIAVLLIAIWFRLRRVGGG